MVATPIGNRADLSPRARDTLAAVDLVCAEDTRHSGAFLAQLGIAVPLLSVHEHNESERIPEVVARLVDGRSVALVSDAGTPLVSDPGYRLVAAAAAAGVSVVPIPGPSAVVAALSVAGLPTDRFAFEGFLPARAQRRRGRLAELRGEVRTLVFYEAPHRLAEALADIAAEFDAARPVVVCRELTKVHETVYRDTAAALAQRAAEEPNMSRGEAVIVVAGAAVDETRQDSELSGRLLRALLPVMPLSRAVDLVVETTGERRNAVYERALALRQAADSDDA